MLGKGYTFEHLNPSDFPGLNFMGKTFATRYLVANMC